MIVRSGWLEFESLFAASYRFERTLFFEQKVTLSLSENYLFTMTFLSVKLSVIYDRKSIIVSRLTRGGAILAYRTECSVCSFQNESHPIISKRKWVCHFKMIKESSQNDSYPPHFKTIVLPKINLLLIYK